MKVNGATGYTTSATKVATVDKNGVVTPIATGKAKITATLSNKKKVTLTLTVFDPTLPTKIALDRKGTVTLDVRDTLALGCILTPDTAVSDILWKSSAPAVATVDGNGHVTPVKAGSVTITATTARGGKSAKVKLKITDLHAPTKVVIEQGKKFTVKLSDGTIQLSAKASAKVEPAITTFTWKSGNTAVATVDANGMVTFHKAGKAKITVQTAIW